MKKKINVIASIVLAGMVSAVQAEVIAQYDFTEASAVSSDSHAGTTAGDYSPNVGAISSGNEDKYTATLDVAGNLTDSIAGGDYDSITITHNSGGALEWGTFDYKYTFYNPYVNGIIYSLLLVDQDNDGWETTDEVGRTFITGTQDGGTQVANGSIDISSLDDFSSGSVEFRLYYVDTSGSAARYHRVDDLTVNAIPEPATLGLFAIASAGIIFLRRKIMI